MAFDRKSYYERMIDEGYPPSVANAAIFFHDVDDIKRLRDDGPMNDGEWQFTMSNDDGSSITLEGNDPGQVLRDVIEIAMLPETPEPGAS